MNTEYSIKQVSKILNMEQPSIRYIEKTLNLKIKRNSNGNRLYTAKDVELLLKIKDLRDQGLNYNQIKEYIKEETEQELKQLDKVNMLEKRENNNADNTAQIIENIVNEFIITKIKDLLDINKKELAADIADIKEMQKDLNSNINNIETNIQNAQKEHYDKVDKRLIELKQTLEKRRKNNKTSWLKKILKR